MIIDGKKEAAILREEIKKEIALIKNTSVNTVNVSKTRLRKKLGLNNNQEVLPYLLTFN